MMSGFDRYYQIVKCFRDEDLRADRQPEFTQIDIETSFLSSATACNDTEKLVHDMWKELLDVELGQFPVMPFSEAIRRFGSDKPDSQPTRTSRRCWLTERCRVQSISLALRTTKKVA